MCATISLTGGHGLREEHDPREAVLLGDIGGTNARFAVLTEGQLGAVEKLPAVKFAGFAEALRAFIDSCPGGLRLTRAILGVAGPIHNDSVTLTNNDWHIDAEELCREFGFESVRLLNDFAAIAWSLPQLVSNDLFQLGGGEPCEGKPKIVLGPGTGFGFACLISGGKDPVALETEAGHMTQPGISQREDAIIQYLRERFSHVSTERVLCGNGLVNLHHAIAAIDGTIAPIRTSREITESAIAGSCLLSQAVLDMFCEMLGTFAGNAALTFGAKGGIYIAGGIVPEIVNYLEMSRFRERFEAKGRMRPYLSNVPVYVITRPDPAFPGLKALAEKS